MKKLVKWGAVGLLVAAAVLTVVYRAVNRVPSSELPLNEQVYEIFTDGGCLSCHSADPKLPFYAKVPVAGDVIKADIDSGYRAFDMTKFMEQLKAGEQVNAVELAKVEKVVLDDRMPMAKYYLVHWGSSLTPEKRAIVLEWVAAMRAAIYNDGLTGDRANEPVRPIDQTLEYDAAKAALGFALFHDTRLSIDNTVSCASCHALETAGVDNHQYSHGVNDQLGELMRQLYITQYTTSFSSGTDVLRLLLIRLLVRHSTQWKWHLSHSIRSLPSSRLIRSLQRHSMLYIQTALLLLTSQMLSSSSSALLSLLTLHSTSGFSVMTQQSQLSSLPDTNSLRNMIVQHAMQVLTSEDSHMS